MKQFTRQFWLVLWSGIMLSLAGNALALEKSNIMLMELKTGTVKIELREDLAPNHVERIKQVCNTCLIC